MSPPHLARCMLAVVALSTVFGCSAADRYGSEARYAPSYRAYVIAPDNGSDDPAKDDATIVLRDPITDRKIRCREDLERWIDRHRDKAKDDIHDENWGIASPLIMLPFTLVAALGLDVAAIGMAYAEMPYQIARSDDPFTIYERGEEAFAADDWEEAIDQLELSLVKGQYGLAPYYLGIAYANTGEWDEAVEALTAFVERALVQEVTAYRNAERWLRYLDEPMPACKSQKPIKIRW